MRELRFSLFGRFEISTRNLGFGHRPRVDLGFASSHETVGSRSFLGTSNNQRKPFEPFSLSLHGTGFGAVVCSGTVLGAEIQ